MEYLQIDETKCQKDGLCAALCPHQLISMESGGPRAVDTADQRCVACGHCVAVCPQGAVSHGRAQPEQCKLLEPNWRLDPERVSQMIRGRRSVRRFRPQRVSRETLEQMVATARYAPSGFNIQPVRWTVVHGPEQVRQVATLVVEWMRGVVAAGAPIAQAVAMPQLIAGWDAGRDPITYGAPHLICAHAPETAPAGSVSCIVALSYLELAGVAHGVGTCWAGFVQMAAETPGIREALALPVGSTCGGLLMVGHPQYQFRRVPPRRPAEIHWT